MWRKKQAIDIELTRIDTSSETPFKKIIATTIERYLTNDHPNDNEKVQANSYRKNCLLLKDDVSLLEQVNSDLFTNSIISNNSKLCQRLLTGIIKYLKLEDTITQAIKTQLSECALYAPMGFALPAQFNDQVIKKIQMKYINDAIDKKVNVIKPLVPS